MSSSEISTLAEIRALFPKLPKANQAGIDEVAEREGQLTKPAGSLGRLEDITSWLAAWQGEGVGPKVEHPRTAVFAGNHGVAAQGVSAFPAEVTKQMVGNFINGGAAVNQLCGYVDADLRVYELDLDKPTADFTQGPAMTEEEVVKAIAYGMMAVEPGIDLLCLGEMGIGNTTSAAAICLALYGGEAKDWTGPGTGVEGDAYNNKVRVVSEGVIRNAEAMSDGLEVLRCVGGLEIAAIAGAILAARMANVPVLLDGFICTAAAATLEKTFPSALDHCLVAHASAEPGHQSLAAKIGKKPLLDLGMRLGEGSGATLAVALCRAAVACHTGMATFAEAAVSGADSE